MKKNKCIFLDRDGTINKYKCLLHNKDDLFLEQGAAKAIKMINESEYLCIVISNQSVVARNLCTMQEVQEINLKLEELLYKENGAYLDDIFICPHHPDSGFPEENKKYKIKCSCRKPNIGMIEEAVRKYNIDVTQSYIVGDTTIDIQTGKNAGLKTILVKTGLAGMDHSFDIEADVIVENIMVAVEFILSRNSIEKR